jgi:predicted HNH restriction endonuclease
MLVKDADGIVENVLTLNKYAKSTGKEYREFFAKRIKNGKWIVAVRQGRDYIFAPSKFSGYASNDISHENKLYSRNGGDTNKAITRILGKAIDQGDSKHTELNEAFRAFCLAHKIEPSRHQRPRRFWVIDQSRSIPTAFSISGVEEHSEGKAYVKAHSARERKAGVRKMLLSDRRSKGLICEICGLSRPDLDPVMQEAIFEAHHVVPLASTGKTRTKLADLSLLCACCHRLIHRAMVLKSGWVSVAEARTLFVPG